MHFNYYGSKCCISINISNLRSTGRRGSHRRQKKSHSRKYAVQTEFIVPKITANYWLVFEIEDAGSGDGLPSGLAVLTLMSVQDIKKKPAISNGFFYFLGLPWILNWGIRTRINNITIQYHALLLLVNFQDTPKNTPKIRNHRRFCGAQVTITLNKMQAHIWRI